MKEDHQSISLMASRLINGRPKKKSSKWPPNNKVLDQSTHAKEIFFHGLAFHFVIEEEVLFHKLYLIIKEKSVKELLELLMDQHVKIKELFWKLNSGKETNKQIRSQLIEIGKTLEKHIDIVDNQIIPVLKKEIDENVLLTIFSEMKKIRPFNCLHLL